VALAALTGCNSNPWIAWNTNGPVSEIWGMRADGSSLGLYTRGHSDFEPTIDHRGQRIVFARANARTFELWVSDFGGHNPRRLLTNTNQAVLGVEPTWHPDGNRIFFVQNGAVDYRRFGDIAVYDLTTRQVSTIVTGTHYSQPSVSPDGTKLAFSQGWTGGASRQVFVANVDGSGVTALGPGTSPAWSRDGSKIAFEGRTTANETEIFVMNADGTGRRQLTSQPYSQMPAYCPCGTRIAYRVRAPAGGDAEIWWIEASGGAPEQLTNTPNVEEYHPTFNGSP
jgi:Tol biopolymer transport system component